MNTSRSSADSKPYRVIESSRTIMDVNTVISASREAPCAKSGVTCTRKPMPPTRISMWSRPTLATVPRRMEITAFLSFMDRPHTGEHMYDSSRAYASDRRHPFGVARPGPRPTPVERASSIHEQSGDPRSKRPPTSPREHRGALSPATRA